MSFRDGGLSMLESSSEPEAGPSSSSSPEGAEPLYPLEVSSGKSESLILLAEGSSSSSSLDLGSDAEEASSSSSSSSSFSLSSDIFGGGKKGWSASYGLTSWGLVILDSVDGWGASIFGEESFFLKVLGDERFGGSSAVNDIDLKTPTDPSSEKSSLVSSDSPSQLGW
ncbi:uncharacterized protein LOC104907017 [Beta vulgaris subsp. vulgaris]|uniref:uncharacterized protein LOC104907017 n=1 Tax=Beta vulgaris subsp. vulgaris TaxID=3555 RepID=UPI00053F7BCC|nr:uncharacterized protein LOC104907017 [Beta vulgaris subsp. vulgaris]